jgi:ribosome biogenesis SPOUT family RNA methylase Rps3
VIEHYEQEVSKWTLCEYTHMIMILSDLYCTSAKPNKLILANFPFKCQLKQGALQEDEYGTLKHTQQFLKINENLGHKCLMSKHKLLELTSKDSLEKIIADNS